MGGDNEAAIFFVNSKPLSDPSFRETRVKETFTPIRGVIYDR